MLDEITVRGSTNRVLGTLRRCGVLDPDLAPMRGDILGNRSMEQSPSPSDTRDGLSFEALRMRGALEGRLFGAEVPVRIGRFVVVELLGSGGMGVVYRAFDPRLDRSVALKSIRRGRGAAQRLEREAQALAKLKHPNVVTVHEIGDGPEGLFIAMEHVEGGTLEQWCQRNPIGTRGRVQKLVELARQAAAGLQAAHAVGVVHRDLKPSNMLIGVDGRLRIADFGLASLGMLEPSETSPGKPRIGVADSHSDTRLTASGELLGTPAYMAPEGLDGHADERSDQFGLCASFFEALVGRRRHAGDSLAELRASFGRASIPPPPPADAPAWLLAVLERGLAIDPAQRFPDIEALARALDAGQSRRRRRLFAGAAILALGIGGALVNRAGACDDEAIGAAWDDERRAELRAAFVNSGLESAPDTLERVEASLGRTTERWRKQRVEACEATRSRSATRAMAACVEQARTTIDETTAGLAVADDEVVIRAGAVVDLLADLTDCARASRDEGAAEAGAAAIGALHRGRIALQLARLDEAEVALREALASAEDNDLPRARSEAHAALAKLHDTREEPAVADEHAELALDAAEIAGDPDLRALRWIALATMLDRHTPQLEHAQFMFERARRLEQAGLLDASTIADIDHLEGGLFKRHQRWTEAIPLLERAAERFLAGGQTFKAAQARLQLSESLSTVGDADEGVVAGVSAVEIVERHLGPDHPEVAWFRLSLAQTQAHALDFRGGEAMIDRSIATFEAHPSFRPSLRASAYVARGKIRFAQGRAAESLADVDRGIAVFVGLGVGGHGLADAYRDRARALRSLDRAVESLAALDEAARHEPEAPPMTVLYDLRDRAEALAQLDRSSEVDAMLAALAPLRAELPETGYVWFQLAEDVARIMTRIGRTADAIAELERTLPRADANHLGIRVRLELQLARTLVAHGDRAAALVHARAAEQAIADGGNAQPRDREQIAALIAELER